MTLPPTIKTGITSRADLIDLLTRNANSAQIEALGFTAKPRDEKNDKPPEPSTSIHRKIETESDGSGWTQFQPCPTTFWRVVAADLKEEPQNENDEEGVEDEQMADRPLKDLISDLQELMHKSLDWRPLASESCVLTRLRKASTPNQSRLETDLPKAVELLSRGHFLYRVPRRARKVWGHDLLVIEDRSRRLVPYWDDQDLLSHWLYKIYPESGFQYARLDDGHERPRRVFPAALRDEPLELPVPGSLVLAVSDLGVLANSSAGDSDPREVWKHWGRTLRDNGNQAIALIPCGCEQVPSELADLWCLVPWDASQRAASAEARTSLLRLISPCVRLEPRLLRALRLLVPAARRDAGLEANIWQSPLLESSHSDSTPINPQKRLELLAEFKKEAEELRAKALQQISATRYETPWTWMEELISLDSESKQIKLVEQQVEFARAGFANLPRQAGDETLRESMAWIEDLSDRLPNLNHLPNRVRKGLEELASLISRPEGRMIPHWQNTDIRWQDGTEQTVRVFLKGDRLLFEPKSPNEETREIGLNPNNETGRFLAAMRTVGGRFHLHAMEAPSAPADWQDNFWENGSPPAWVRDFGCDRFGLWCAFKVKNVQQRMRWLSAGKFNMGSPDDEEGRDDDEGPQHEVTISRGFWMFDTPCTQALWKAVTGESPSRFKGDRRPVEQVSWNDVQAFTKELGSLLPDIEVRLPTESEWEYSCRAGSDEARYGELDAVAWYDANSDNKTHDVGEKLPNKWGLNDSLGNVYEWCQDTWCRKYQAKSAIDPMHEVAGNVNRVIRGGSWSNSAAYVRAAYRRNWLPEVRYDNVGFRCLSSSESSQPSGAAIRQSESMRSGAEPTAKDGSLRGRNGYSSSHSG